MIEIGKKQELTVLRKVSFGAYLGETSSAHRGKTELSEVLLPGSQMPQGLKEGDVLKVFVYRDSSDRPIATTAEPALTLGEVKVLKVKEVTRIGAFLPGIAAVVMTTLPIMFFYPFLQKHFVKGVLVGAIKM